MELIYPESGFGNILGQILKQKLGNPKKAEFAKRIRGELVLEIKNLGVCATIRFMGNRIEILDKKVGGATSFVSANMDVINELFTGVSLMKVLKLIITRKLKVKGFGMARKFALLIS